MTEEQIRGATYIAKKMINIYNKRGGGYSQKQALQTLISLAEQYLAVQGMPRKKESIYTSATNVQKAGVRGLSKLLKKTSEIEGYNQAIDEATLCVMKMCGVERISNLLIPLISKIPIEERIIKLGSKYSIHTIIAQAIHKAIVGGANAE